MYIIRKPSRGEEEVLPAQAEVKANRFNLKCVGVLCTLAVLSVILNLCGLFPIPDYILIPIMSTAAILFLLPLLLYFLFGGKEEVLRKPWLRPLIIVCVYLGIALICTTLSFHGIIIMAIPPLLAAQYRINRRLFFRTLIPVLLLVPIGVYGSYLFGIPDWNLLKDFPRDADVMDLSLRLAYLTPQRAQELFFHYVLPRLFGMLAIVFLLYGINNRHEYLQARQRELSRQVQEEMQRLNGMQSKVIDALATLIENRDEDTGEHVIRTKLYVRLIADALCRDETFRERITPEEAERWESAAPLHDVGKIAVPDSILLKPGRLTPEEFDRMKSHTTKGGAMVRSILEGMNDEAFLKTAEDIALCHHERWDGGGYPRGLKGEDIPLCARIMAVADVFDALVSVRVYKKPITPEAALDTMLEESGTHFDPELMRVVQGMRDILIAAAKAPVDPSPRAA